MGVIWDDRETSFQMSSSTPIHSGEPMPLAKKHLPLWPPFFAMLISILVAVGAMLAEILILLPNLKFLVHVMVTDGNHPEMFRTALRGLGDRIISPSVLICAVIAVVSAGVFAVASFRLRARLFARW